MEEEHSRIQELERQKEEERLRKEQELERIRKEKEMEEERKEFKRLKDRKRKIEKRTRIRENKERKRNGRRETKNSKTERGRKIETRTRNRETAERERNWRKKTNGRGETERRKRLRQERERETKERKRDGKERRRFQELERQKEEERLKQERELARLNKEKEMEEERRRTEILKEEKLRQEREHEMEMETCEAAERLREEVPTSSDLISFWRRGAGGITDSRLHCPDRWRLASAHTSTLRWLFSETPKMGNQGETFLNTVSIKRNSCCSWPQSTARIKVQSSWTPRTMWRSGVCAWSDRIWTWSFQSTQLYRKQNAHIFIWGGNWVQTRGSARARNRWGKTNGG